MINTALSCRCIMWYDLWMNHSIQPSILIFFVSQHICKVLKLPCCASFAWFVNPNDTKCQRQGNDRGRDDKRKMGWKARAESTETAVGQCLKLNWLQGEFAKNGAIFLGHLENCEIHPLFYRGNGLGAVRTIKKKRKRKKEQSHSSW